MSTRPTLYILDSYSMIFQVFHALPEMTGPAGQPTQAVFGIIRDILNILRDRKPDYLAAAFDGAGPVFRSDIYAEYKANRAAMPEDLVPQIPLIRRAFEGFQIPVLIQPGFEADDIIATLARIGEERGLDVFVCTADKDARQLISEHVKIVNLRKNVVMDAQGLENDWGIRPDQVVDFLALTGDTVDNVPGVPGIGPGFASTFLKQFGSLDNLFENLDQIKGKKQQSLREHRQTALRARELVKLRDDIDMELNWDQLQTRTANTTDLKALCVECGFHRFITEISERFDRSESVPTSPASEWKAEYRVVDSPELLASFLEELRRQKSFCVDTETTSKTPLLASLVGLAFSWNEGEAYYLPLRGPMGATLLDETTTLDALRPILTDPTIEKVGQNLKYDMLALGRAGVELAGPVTDTMILSYLLESGERNHSLDQLSERLLNHTMIPITDLIGKGKNQLKMDLVEVSKVGYYAGEDADATWRIKRILEPEVQRQGLWPLYAELERPLIQVLARMETRGIKVDLAKLQQLSKDFGAEIEKIEEEVYGLAGHPFNLGSPPQLRQVLFEELKLPSLQKTPGGEKSTAQEVLEELALKHPLPALLVRHRQLAKLKSTYLDALPLLIHPDDGRIHASFNQGVAATGRLSSSDPNLQNIPVRTDEGRQIRQAFIAGEPNWMLLTADYSQIELRILAHYSGDRVLTQAFDEDHDIHSVVASQIYQVAESGVTSAMRRVAKTVNFGVIYGLSPFGLAGRLGIPQSEAAHFIDAYFKQYEGVETFITKTLESARDMGRVETILGRRRPIQGIKNTTGRIRNLAERTAVNTVIQGSAADLIKKAMIQIDEAISRRGLESRMLLQIHDELVFEAPKSELPELAELVRHEMTSALELTVPLKVDLAAGPNWLDVDELPLDAKS